MSSLEPSAWIDAAHCGSCHPNSRPSHCRLFPSRLFAQPIATTATNCGGFENSRLHRWSRLAPNGTSALYSPAMPIYGSDETLTASRAMQYAPAKRNRSLYCSMSCVWITGDNHLCSLSPYLCWADLLTTGSLTCIAHSYIPARADVRTPPNVAVLCMAMQT